ncbi:MAG TPA: PAS domain S-box protein [Candidatus Saccharicenans sp.]|nr:PAS domain S-box protein [Candidatus Saccharicenans sp.]HQM75277.1 PAS domain S-box protein [Candidatus Saccharicenans sp.]
MYETLFKSAILSISNYAFTPFALAVFLTGWIALAIGILVLIREKASRESLLFFLITLAILIWLGPNSFMYASPNEEMALSWSRLSFIGVSFIPSTFFQFTIFALRTSRSNQKKAWLGWIVSFFFAILALTSDRFYSGMEQYAWGYYPHYTWLGIPFLIFFFFMLLSSFWQYHQKSRQAASYLVKLRTRLFFRAFSIAGLAVIDFLPATGINIPPLGFIPILSFAFLGAPVIWRYHLVDITPAFASQEIINNMSDALLVFDREGLVQLVNPAFCQLLEKKEEELKGFPARTILPSLFSSEEIQFALENGSRAKYSFTFTLKDNRELFLEASLSPIQKASSEVLAWVVLIRDITELKKAQERLSQSEIRYRTIFENTGSATILIEEDMTISLANREFEKLVGLPKEEIEGRRKFTQFFIPPDVFRMVEYHQKRRIDHNTVPKKYASHLIDQEGKIREVLISVDVIPQTRQSVASLMDMTDLKLAEEQIAFQLDMLSRLYQGARTLAETLDLEKLAGLAVRYSVQDFGARAAFLLVQNEEKEWQTLSVFPDSFSQVLQDWLKTGEKNRFLTDLMHRDSPLEVNLTEPSPYPRLEETVKKLPVKGVKAFLLGKSSEPWGALIWLADEPGFLSSDLAAFVRTFVQQIITSGEQARLFSRLQKYIEVMRSLYSIERTIASSLDLQMVLDFTLQEAMHHLKVEASCVYLIDSTSSVLHYKAGLGFLHPEAIPVRLRLGNGTLDSVVMDKKQLFIADLRKEPLASFLPLVKQEQFQSLLAIPLEAKGKTQGVLIVFNRSPLYPSPDLNEFLTNIGGQLAIAIDNIGMFEELNRSHLELTMAYDTTIEGWAQALELRDQETEGHARRVADLTIRLARALDVPAEQLVHIRRGAILHDIGKMGIPDQILLKPGPLTMEEREIMKKHPIYARQLLLPIKYLHPAIDIPYCHHERWDGTGYPQGLKGEQIPLAARIFAVIDVWDALISDRPYRSAWPEEKALNYIREQAGHHFDPRVVEKFLELLLELEKE